MEDERNFEIKEESLDINDDHIIPSIDYESTVDYIKIEVTEPEKNSKENSVFAQKPYRCDICSKRFSQETSLTSHVASVHEGKKPIFQCDQCSKKFARKNGLSQHMNVTHNGETVKCEFCNKELSSKSYLTYHIAAVHEKKETI